MSHQRLTNFPEDPVLDLEPWVGQRQAGYRFELSNRVTGEQLGTITPIRNATLSHDTGRTIKRQLTLNLGVADTAAVNTLTDQVSVFMTFPSGVEFPLGRFMFTDGSRQVFTSGIPGPHTAGGLGDMTLNDQMFIVDQEIEKGINGTGKNVANLMRIILEEFDLDLDVEATPFLATSSWGAGTTRGSILESLSITGDYFSPWFGNDNKFHCIRTFDPFGMIPDFDFDENNKVIREPIIETDDLLTAPNVFIVVSNGAIDPSAEVVGRAEVPSSAPHSKAQRGFSLPLVLDLQIGTGDQASAVARAVMQRSTVFERVTLTTPPDPRHDSYNIIRWQGDTWLELAWSLTLTAGGAMSHVLRKTYRP